MKHYILHKSKDRGFSDHGWLKSAFSFSFADWYEPTRMGFETLRVINDDIIKAKNGFGFHPHKDMEIITILLKGELSHQDTMGNKEVIKEGEVQRMSAGTGVFHSEMNDHSSKDVHSFQIWIETRKNGINPSYEQKYFDPQNRKNSFKLLVSPNGRKESLFIHQDAYISRIELEKGKKTSYTKFEETNSVYVMVIDGTVTVNEYSLERRDALGIRDILDITFLAQQDCDLIVYEVPNKK